MPKKRPRVFSRAFKLAAVRRMIAGENVSALSRELQVLRKDLNYWRDHFKSGGPEALRGRGRPRKTEIVPAPAKEPPGEIEKARERIAELERKVGRQQIDLDFFRQALRRVGEARRPNAKLGVSRSTRSTKR
jgi:transposase